MEDKVKLREYKNVEDVLEFVVERLDEQIASYRLVDMIGEIVRESSNSAFLDSAPEHIDIMLRNTSAQVDALQQAKRLIAEMLLERRTLAAVGSLKAHKE